MILCVPLTSPSTVISPLYARLGAVIDAQGRWVRPVLFEGCSPTAPPCDTGGHVVVGANRGREGQLPCSMHVHTSLSHCLLHLCWASTSGVVSSQNLNWRLSEPKMLPHKAGKRPACGWGLEGSNGQFSKCVREGVCLESYLLSSMVLTLC